MIAASPGPIYYFCTDRHSYTIGVFLDYYNNELKGVLRIIPYEQIRKLGSVPPGTFVFTDLDRLSPAQKQSAIGLHKSIVAQSPDLLLLNDPDRVPGRFDLLKRLKAAGLNRFDVHRLHGRGAIRRFPVFLRWASQHIAPLTGLIEDEQALEAAIVKLPAKVKEDIDLMIVEFGSAPSADGRFRKYSAYKVGDTMYPQHCFIGPDWYIKFPSTRFNEADRAESRTYVNEHPHASQIERVFEVAGMGYGRIDYGIVDGKVQTFEINSNPTVLANPPGWDPTASYERYAELHDRALQAIIRPQSGPPVRMGVGHGTADEIHADVLRRLRRWVAWRYVKRRAARTFGRR